MMLKRHNLAFFFCLLFFATLGCSKSSEIDIVKTGFLDIDKGITVEQAFQNYKYFKTVEWKKLTLDNGRTIVEVDAALDIAKMPEYSIWRTNEKLGLKNVRAVYQFQVNKDNTFQVFAGGFRYTHPSGKDEEQAMNQRLLINVLKTIYRNDPNI
jgi:hypothetical protein